MALIAYVAAIKGLYYAW